MGTVVILMLSGKLDKEKKNTIGKSIKTVLAWT